MAAVTFVLALGVAGATDRDEQSPEGRAYLGFSFGGERAAPRDFHYGLRLDHDSRFVDRQAAPPVMQVDFTRQGLNAARLNGLNVLKQQYQLRQAEEEVAEGGEEALEEEGFFEGMFSGVADFFGGLFGGDEEEAAEETAEAAEETAEEAPEELAEGTFMGYNAIDWGLLAVGAVGIGFIGSEVSNADETSDQQVEEGGGDGGDGGGDGGMLPGVVPAREGAPGMLPMVRERSPEYQDWLDGGTGQMGDLGG